jgi:hypothetical protein
LRPGLAFAKNETGADLGFAKPAPLYINRTALSPTALPVKDWDTQKFLYRLGPAVSMTSANPSPPSSMAVTTEPIANNEIGIVAISGVAAVYVNWPALGAYLKPCTGNVVASGRWGWGRLLSYTDDNNTSIVDLSSVFLQTVYEITAISSGTITAKIDPGDTYEYSDTLYDNNSIAAWQVVGDKGLCQWSGSQWQIIVPWCVE